MKYKMQPGENEPLEWDKLGLVIKRVLFNQFVVQVPVALIEYALNSESYSPERTRMLPTFGRFLFEFFVFEVIYEVCFYYAHRTAHHKLFYKLGHKKHHEFTGEDCETLSKSSGNENLFK